MIDCHCHFDMMENPEEYIARMDRLGHSVIGMTNRPCYFKEGSKHIKPYKRIRLALGLHPLQLEDVAGDLMEFEDLVGQTSYIGEVGLDFSTEGKKTKDKQIGCFEEILGILSGKSKILSVHSRQAERTVLDLLDLFYQENVIFHWYTGSKDLIPEIVEHGYYFSVNEAMLSSSHGRELILNMPKDRVLTESDAPYNSKADIQKTIDGLAGIWKMSCSDVGKVIDNNFSLLLKGLG